MKNVCDEGPFIEKKKLAKINKYINKVRNLIFFHSILFYFLKKTNMNEPTIKNPNSNT